MTIICPHCGFSKEVDETSIPAEARKVTCPSCKRAFSLGAELDRELSPVEPPVAALPQTVPLDDPAPEGFSTARMPDALFAAGLPKAGFWIRTMAALLDSIAITLVQLILGFILGLFASTLGGLGGDDGQAIIGVTAWLLGCALSVAYYVFFTGYCGQTPGKMALSIKVIRTDGSDIGYGRAAFREIVGKFVSGILLGIGYLMVAFDAQKQGLHDKMADTYVVKV